jgi:hypothetical protein
MYRRTASVVAPVLAAVATTLAAAACGGPTFTVQGKVESALTAEETSEIADAGMKAAVVWIAGAESSGIFPVADVADVNGALPSDFTLTIREPEEASFIELETDQRTGQLESIGQVAIGFIVALPADAAVGDKVDLTGLIGVSQQHMVIYAPNEASAAAVPEFMNASFRDVREGFNIIDVAVTSAAYELCQDDTVNAIDACHNSCDETCDPDSAEDPGCDLCRVPCNTTLSDDFHACDELINRVVGADTLLSLTLDPSSVASSPVWTLGQQEAPTQDELGDEGNEGDEGDGQPSEEPTEEPSEPSDG